MAQQQSEMNPQLMQLMQMLGIGGGLGSAAGGTYNLFGGGGKNPATGANNIIGQIPGATKQYYQPYMDAGKGAMGNLQNQYKDLLSGDVQNKLGANYQQSPGYQFKLQQAMGAGNNAAAAGGMAGSGQHQFGNMQTANDLANADYGDYMKNQMGLYGLGLGGNEGLNKMGFDASGKQADSEASTLGQQGAYSYAGQAGQNQKKSDAWGNIFSGLGMAGGAALGGPAGAGGIAALMKMLGIGG